MLETSWDKLLEEVSKSVEYGSAETPEALTNVASNRRLSPEETHELQRRYEEFCVESC